MPGEELVQIADHISILNDGEPTFLATNGYSVIDLGICYGPLFDRCKHSLSTDEFAELFTGAPQRSHVPVIMSLERSSITEKTKKLWIEKPDWVGWTSFIEGRIDDLMAVGDDPSFFGTSSRICCTKLPLVIYPSNVFQIIANRFGTQT